MDKITLKDFVAEHGQRGAGQLIGVTQGAVGQMLQNRREIYIVEHADRLEAWEWKPVGNARFKDSN